MRSLTAVAALAILFTGSVAFALENDRAITVNPSNHLLRRSELITYVWGSGGLPLSKLPAAADVTRVTSPLSGLTNLESVDRIVVRMDQGKTGLVHYYVPRARNSRAVVMVAGHACRADLNDGPGSGRTDVGYQRTTKALLDAGYSVLFVYMPGYTPDSCAAGHDQLFDNLPAVGNPLKYFLEPVTVALNYLQKGQAAIAYQDYSMVGLSGGGWTTTVYAALDTRIKHSFPVSGTVPLYMRVGNYSHDREQFDTKPLDPANNFYRKAGYPDLYVLGSVGQGRRQYQILNRWDNCCFGQRQHNAGVIGADYDSSVRGYEASVKATVASIGAGGGFRAVIDEVSPYHMISEYAIREVMLPVLGGSSSLATTIRSVAGGNLCIDVPDFGRAPQSGDQLQIYSCHGGANQLFDFRSDGSIRSRRGGLCIDVPDHGRAPISTDRLQLYTCNGGINQQFDVRANGTIQARWGNLCADVPDYGRAPANGDPIQQWTCQGLANQRFSVNR